MVFYSSRPLPWILSVFRIGFYQCLAGHWCCSQGNLRKLVHAEAEQHLGQLHGPRQFPNWAWAHHRKKKKLYQPLSDFGPPVPFRQEASWIFLCQNFSFCFYFCSQGRTVVFSTHPSMICAHPLTDLDPQMKLFGLKWLLQIFYNNPQVKATRTSWLLNGSKLGSFYIVGYNHKNNHVFHRKQGWTSRTSN